jgi:hypothetical protein
LITWVTGLASVARAVELSYGTLWRSTSAARVGDRCDSEIVGLCMATAVSREEIIAQTGALKQAVEAVFELCHQQLQPRDVYTRSQAHDISQDCMAAFASQVAATLELCEQARGPRTRAEELLKEVKELEEEMEQKVLLVVAPRCRIRGR